MKIRILDDIYGKNIYEGLKRLLPNFEYPVKDNINSPIPYLWEIKDWDIVCLDNWFPWEYWEEPLWDDFLRQYLRLWKSFHIICLSNVWQNIIKRHEQRCKVYNQWDIIWFAPNKDPRDIVDIINEYSLLN